MKTIVIILINIFISFNIFATDIELKQATETFHKRLVQRAPEYYKGSTIQLIEEIPEEIEEISSYQYLDLIKFATEYELLEEGFSYKLNRQYYEITNPEGLAIAYTFSIIIFKNDTPSAIGMYELIRRVDGVFYLGRDPAWY